MEQFQSILCRKQCLRDSIALYKSCLVYFVRLPIVPKKLWMDESYGCDLARPKFKRMSRTYQVYSCLQGQRDQDLQRLTTKHVALTFRNGISSLLPILIIIVVLTTNNKRVKRLTCSMGRLLVIASIMPRPRAERFIFGRTTTTNEKSSRFNSFKYFELWFCSKK